MGEPNSLPFKFPTFYAVSRNAQPWGNHTIFNSLQKTKLIHWHQTVGSIPLAGAIFSPSNFPSHRLVRLLSFNHLFRSSGKTGKDKGTTSAALLSTSCSSLETSLCKAGRTVARYLQHHKASPNLGLEAQNCITSGFIKISNCKVLPNMITIAYYLWYTDFCQKLLKKSLSIKKLGSTALLHIFSVKYDGNIQICQLFQLQKCYHRTILCQIIIVHLISKVAKTRSKNWKGLRQKYFGQSWIAG